MRKLLIIVLLLPIQVLIGQVGGESIFAFLNVPTSARNAAMGGNVITMHNDIDQPQLNPSMIGEEIDRNIGLNYVDFLSDIGYGSLSYAHKVNDKIGVIYGGVIYANYGSFIEADESGNELGTFKASDVAVTLGYAYKIPTTNLKFGANVKYISSSIAQFSSSGIAGDFSIRYKKDDKPFIFTAMVRNVGTQLTTYDGTNEDLPLDVAVGFSYRLTHVPLRWHITLDNLQQWDISFPNPSNATTDIEGNTTQEDISFFNNAMRHFSIGAELFTERAFNIRLGYNFRRGQELNLVDSRNVAGLTFGLGLKMGRFKFNYAFSQYHPVSNSNTFSLKIDLNKQ